MARPVKKGLNYFPKDVEFFNDYKIMDLLERYGPIGVTVYEVLLSEVYRNGYYLAEPIDRVSANVVRIIGAKWVQKRLVSQVILDCGELGLFETTLLKHGVITSVGIQRRYAAVTSRNKVHKAEFWLIDEDGQPLLNAPQTAVSVAETAVFVAETRVNEAVIPQKESKANKTKQNKKNSSELKTSPRANVAFQLLLIDGSYYSVCQSDVEKYASLYPAVDVEQEFRNMIGWLDSNPKNRKTPRGIVRFINGWLCRTQDSARPSNSKPSVPNKFHNFQQREDVNYNELVLKQAAAMCQEGMSQEESEGSVNG